MATTISATATATTAPTAIAVKGNGDVSALTDACDALSLTAAKKDTVLASGAAAEQPTTEVLHVPVSTGADITSDLDTAAAKAAAKAAVTAANKAACQAACPVAAAIAAAPCKVMAAIKSVVSAATGMKLAPSACAEANSLTAMTSSEPPMIIKPVLTAAAAPDTTTTATATAPATATATTDGKSSAAAEKKLSLQELVHSISQELNSPNKCMKRVRSLMERYDASGGEWRRYAFWDAATNYTRNLIATDQKTFTLMQLCWNPSKWSPCHDHNGSECFMRMVEGQLVEVRYAWPEPGADVSKPLKVLSQTTLNPGCVCFINDSLGLHKVGNPSSSTPAVSLHCYIPGYDTCKAWCQPDKSGKCIEANISYYSELGKKACH